MMRRNTLGTIEEDGGGGAEKREDDGGGQGRLFSSKARRWLAMVLATVRHQPGQVLASTRPVMASTRVRDDPIPTLNANAKLRPPRR